MKLTLQNKKKKRKKSERKYGSRNRKCPVGTESTTRGKAWKSRSKYASIIGLKSAIMRRMIRLSSESLWRSPRLPRNLSTFGKRNDQKRTKLIYKTNQREINDNPNQFSRRKKRFIKSRILPVTKATAKAILPLMIL